MKRFGNLYDSITSFSALLSASRKARKRKRYKTSTALFEYHLEPELIRLEKELKDQTYCPGSYREFSIYEPKPRKISAAPYRDRVAQHALCHVIEPIFERSFIFDTYACRIGKGTHKAVDRFSHYSKKFNYRRYGKRSRTYIPSSWNYKSNKNNVIGVKVGFCKVLMTRDGF